MAGSTEDKIEGAVQATMLKLGTRLVSGVYALLIVVVAVSFGGGVWVTRVNEQLMSLTSSLESLAENIPPRWVANELQDANRDIEKLEERLTLLEQSVLLNSR